MTSKNTSNQCWCTELYVLSGYQCYDCEKKLERKPSFKDQKILSAYENCIENKNTPPKDFKRIFSKAEAVREKYDPFHAMRKSEVEARKSEIMLSNQDISFDELCLRLYGKSMKSSVTPGGIK